MSLFVVLGVLIVVSIFAFSMKFLASHATHKARRVAAQKGAMLLARSARAFALAQIYEGLADYDSPIYQKLVNKNLTNGDAIPLDIASLTSLAEEYKQGSVDLSVTIASISQLDPIKLTKTTGGSDEVERKAILKIVPMAMVDGVSYSFEETRQVKIINLVPGILGKFSLFVQQCDANYNKYAANINGEPDDRVSSPHYPVILKNGGELDEGKQISTTDLDGWKRRGFIYLGGGTTVLNLTAGNHEAFGENFHFFNIDSLLEPKSQIPSYFDPDPSGQFSNPPINVWNPISQLSTLPQNALPPDGLFAPEFTFWIKHLVSGFYTKEDPENSDMNVDGRLAVHFPTPSSPGVPNPQMMSSVLHLFGTRSNPSPTLVLGNVFRRYADYSAIVMDATNDKVRDAILTYLNESTGAMPAQRSVIQSSLDSELGPNKPIVIDTTVFSCEALFAGAGGYTEKMCQIFQEPYLRSHDYLYHRNSTNFYPQSSTFPGPANSLAAATSTFTLSLDASLGRSEPFFEEGVLSDLPMEFLLSKCVVKVEDCREFSAHFLNETILNLDTAVLIKEAKDGKYEFPAEVRIEKGGIIVFEKGNVSLGRISTIPGVDDFLIIVALNGNIVIDNSFSGAMKASLFAPKGEIILKNPTIPLDVRGSVVVKRLPADCLQAGGKIVYNTQTDPSAPDYGNYYRGMTSNIALSFREIP